MKNKLISLHSHSVRNNDHKNIVGKLGQPISYYVILFLKGKGVPKLLKLKKSSFNLEWYYSYHNTSGFRENLNVDAKKKKKYKMKIYFLILSITSIFYIILLPFFNYENWVLVYSGQVYISEKELALKSL